MYEMNAARQSRRTVLRATVSFAVLVAGTVLGTVASAQHMDVLNGLAVGIVGITLGVAFGALLKAYMAKVRIPVVLTAH